MIYLFKIDRNGLHEDPIAEEEMRVRMGFYEEDEIAKSMAKEINREIKNKLRIKRRQ